MGRENTREKTSLSVPITFCRKEVSRHTKFNMNTPEMERMVKKMNADELYESTRQGAKKNSNVKYYP